MVKLVHKMDLCTGPPGYCYYLLLKQKSRKTPKLQTGSIWWSINPTRVYDGKCPDMETSKTQSHLALLGLNWISSRSHSLLSLAKNLDCITSSARVRDV